MKKKLLALFTALLCLVLLAQTACAAELSTKIPVKITVSGTEPSTPEKFHIRLHADDASNPMPEGSENGAYTMTIAGEGSGSFSIDFQKVGVYTYTVYQEKGDNPKCTYDPEVYAVKAYVVNDGIGGKRVVINIYDEDGEKVDEIQFHNKYKVEPTDTPQTNDESNFPLYILLAAGDVLVLLALYLTREREENIEDIV